MSTDTDRNPTGAAGDDAPEEKRVSAHTNIIRLASMTVAGIAAGVAVALMFEPAFAVVSGWGVACLVYVVWVWSAVWRFSPGPTRTHAQLEEPARAVSETLVLLASIASIGAVLLLLSSTSSETSTRAVAGVLAVTSVALSWALVHTLYALRYAREYYRDPVGGISFNQSEAPRYSDFAYVAFCLGMTFQISDTDLSSARMRRIVLGHTLLSYLFNTVIVAATVNLVVNLASGQG